MQRSDTQKTIDALQDNWIWIPNWHDSSPDSAGRLTTFTRHLTLPSKPTTSIIHCTADTRYKFLINGERVAIGPTRSSPSIWYYDTLDIAPWLKEGENTLEFVVMRWFAGVRAGMPFVRTTFPGLAVVGVVEGVDVGTGTKGWEARVEEGVRFPMGLVDDVFLHINERVTSKGDAQSVKPVKYGFKFVNGEQSPWRLRPRIIPMPEQTAVKLNTIRKIQSDLSTETWQSFLQGTDPLTLQADSSHRLALQAECHSTAFLRWVFRSAQPARLTMKITYSEGYELEPRQYPWLRTKGDRLDAENGLLLGPHDEVTLDISGEVVYEPFWFRTFRLLDMEIKTEGGPIEMVSFTATQANYPLDVKASWQDDDPDSGKIWQMCVRTMRNCMFDGYSDCPFYEQLQYSGDTRSVGLFHYMLSGDDRLMRQAIIAFASSVTPEGLTQSRVPSQVPQVILGFPLYWILALCDHHLYFGDTQFIRSFLPLVDGVFEFYDRHLDELGLVSGFPKDVWQYVDWVDTWNATAEHPDKGVPSSGRRTNRHTYFSMLYAYVLREVVKLLQQLGRRGYIEEYEGRATSVVSAVKKHCFDSKRGFFTDSTADVAEDLTYSQHCQVFAVLCGASDPSDSPLLLLNAFDPSAKLSKCSYVMKFYAFRAFARAGPEVYERLYSSAWDPWRLMLKNNMSTLEEDDVRQRSDCHAWGAVPIYEYCFEVAGVKPVEAGCRKILFEPRLGLTEVLECKVALGKDSLARVSWRVEGGNKKVRLRLGKAIEVVSRLPGQEKKEHGVVSELDLIYTGSSPAQT